MEIINVVPYSWGLGNDSKFSRRPTRDISLMNVGFRKAFDYETIFYDVFKSHDDTSIICIGPSFFNLKDEVKKCKFYLQKANGNKDIKLEAHITDDLVKCERLIVNLPDNEYNTRYSNDLLHIEGPLGNINLPIGENYSDKFKNKKVLVTKIKNNDLNWITDWINIHQALHGIDGVILFDNNSTAYESQDLIQYIAANTTIDVLCYMHVPFLFGPSAYPGQNWDSDFLNFGIWEIAHQRFLAQADLVYVCDIDEIFIGEKKSTSEAVSNSEKGAIYATATIVEPVTTSLIPQIVDVNAPGYNSPFFLPPFCIVKDTHPKYIYSPKTVSLETQLCVHSIRFRDGSKQLPMNRDVSYRHFKYIATEWDSKGTAGWAKTPSRRKMPVYNPNTHYLDCAFVKKMASVNHPKIKYPTEKIIAYAKSIGACPRKSSSSVPDMEEFKCENCPYKEN